jgi:hypothetical protein
MVQGTIAGVGVYVWTRGKGQAKREAIRQLNPHWTEKRGAGWREGQEGMLHIDCLKYINSMNYMGVLHRRSVALATQTNRVIYLIRLISGRVVHVLLIYPFCNHSIPQVQP